MPQNILIVGNGGREHALAWKLAQSPRIGNLYVAPGNGGTRQIAENVPIPVDHIFRLASFAQTHRIDLTIVGSEVPLERGIVDLFQKKGLRIFGPTKAAERIESSKAFAKHLMQRIGVPTADYRVFRNYEYAMDWISNHGLPVVVKEDGLRGGKGVHICKTLESAHELFSQLILQDAEKKRAGKVVVEEFLEGKEASLHAWCDGKTALLFPPSQDYKPIGEGNIGDNTGGMGTVAPLPWFTEQMIQEARDHIVLPVLSELARLGTPFKGLLYPGLMVNQKGQTVVEFNGRFGDPETQSYMRLLETDLLDILDACVDGNLANISVKWKPGYAVCIVAASAGYPGDYKINLPIYGIQEAEQIPGVVVFYAGTAYADQLYTSGGRVLGVSALADTLREALILAYKAIRLIRFEGKYYRHDIGFQAVSKGF